MKKDKGGYILLYRRLRQNRLWPKRKFTPLEAWLDLLLMANFTREGEWWYDDKDYKKIWLEYGEMVASRRYLAKRWEWKLSTVHKRLGVWEGEHMIKQRSEHGENIILVVNFAKYQKKEKEEVNTEVNGKVNENETELKQMLNKTKEVNKELDNKVNKEVGNCETPKQTFLNFLNSFNERNEEYNQLVSLLEEKGIPNNLVQSELAKFVAYWTEPNSAGTKQRWQMERTFEVKRRLVTWFNNIRKFSDIKETKGIKL